MLVRSESESHPCSVRREDARLESDVRRELAGDVKSELRWRTDFPSNSITRRDNISFSSIPRRRRSDT